MSVDMVVNKEQGIHDRHGSAVSNNSWIRLPTTVSSVSVGVALDVDFCAVILSMWQKYFIFIRTVHLQSFPVQLQELSLWEQFLCIANDIDAIEERKKMRFQ